MGMRGGTKRAQQKLMARCRLMCAVCGLGLASLVIGVAPAVGAGLAPVNEITLDASFGGSGQLSGVSCTSDGICTAAGTDANDEPLVLDESDGVWGSPHEIALGPSLGGFGNLNGISCASAGNCTAVGFDADHRPYALDETGGIWGSPVEIALNPSLDPGGIGFFFEVSCPSAGNCTAVGYDENFEPLVVSESDGVWGPLGEIHVGAAFGGAGYLYGVSCPSVGNCTVAGEDDNNQPLVADESAGVWGPPTELTLGAGFNNGGYPSAVSCSSAGNCAAAGTDFNGQPLLIDESGGVWGAAREVALPVSFGGTGNLTGVSCASVGSCTAVGLDGHGEPFVIDESGGAWGPPRQVKVGANLGVGGFTGVSCVAELSCTNVGTCCNDPHGATQLIVQQPTPANTALPSVTGSTVAGQTLFGSRGNWTGAPPITYTYAWLRCDSDGNNCLPTTSTGLRYQLKAADVGSTLKLQVTAADAATSTSATSAPTAVVEPAAPANVALPAVTGTAVVGQTLNGSRGSWTGTPPITYTYLWLQCDSGGNNCVPTTRTGLNYKLKAPDVGSTLELQVTATNAATSASATSAPTAVVAASASVEIARSRIG